MHRMPFDLPRLARWRGQPGLRPGNMCHVCIYIYIFFSREREREIYIYIIDICIYIYIYYFILKYQHLCM